MNVVLHVVEESLGQLYSNRRTLSTDSVPGVGDTLLIGAFQYRVDAREWGDGLDEVLVSLTAEDHVLATSSLQQRLDNFREAGWMQVLGGPVASPAGRRQCCELARDLLLDPEGLAFGRGSSQGAQDAGEVLSEVAGGLVILGLVDAPGVLKCQRDHALVSRG